MLDCCIINIGWLTLLVDSFTHLVMSFASCGLLILFSLTPTILSLLYIYSIYFDVLIVLFDYSYSMLTSSHYLIFYLILYMYTLIFLHTSFVMI